ncbi:hypothetical protein PBI_SEBATA_264 [Mycobacterium phage Sebata]|uniref:Uncharacterized protein n=1 Tax=Mycobacterium phage Sebata TaxID=1052672 RepID=G1FIX3_9CAUD|nr:hypothetical protein FDI20_gp086 [Mycobacterium phage Sebata]AEK06704.1 hypothetical protein PBI_SEBATA_264 [Mycobacterium phage Sebata]
MKLTHSQRATARHLGMSEDDYLKRDRLIDLTRSTMLKVAEYVEAEQKMSDEIMANWHRSWTT